MLLAACGGSLAQPTAPPAPPAEVDPVLGDPPVTDADQEKLIDAMLARIDRVAECPGSNRIWCIPTRGWAKADAGALPASPFLVTGVSVAFLEASSDDDLLSGLVSFSALGVSSGKEPKALLVDVPATTAAEQRAVAQGIDQTVAVIKKKAEMAELPKALVVHARKVVTEAKYPIRKQGKDWRFAGEASARVRQLGDVWVAIEIPAKGPRGILISVYTARFRAEP
jgi:hypothetical protein